MKKGEVHKNTSKMYAKIADKQGKTLIFPFVKGFKMRNLDICK